MEPVTASRSIRALGYWMGTIAGLLAPLVDGVTGNKAHADDTPLPVLAPAPYRSLSGKS